jgi:site-specific DNA-cytosine methylase
MDGTSKRKNHNQYRLYGVSGLSPTLNKMDGGGREPHIPIPVVCLDPKYKCLEGGMREYEEETPTLTSRDYKDPLQVIVATDNRSKENSGGVYAKVADGTTVYAIWYAKQQRYVAIRKLTPKECFRLQGWSDDYFHKAELMNSNSQLYKQAGNGVTVNVIRAVAEKMKG